jgi:hypothetical protein
LSPAYSDKKVFDLSAGLVQWLGQRGDKTRTENMTPDERKALAQKAAARWKAREPT